MVEPDPVVSALERFEAIDSYRTTMRSTLGNGESQTIRYHYRKPGFVRMEFVQPHAGALLVYSPATREASLWPFGAGSFPHLRLSPGNPMIRGPQGHTVDRSDVGVLLRNVRALQARGTTEVLGREPIAGVQALHVRVTGAARSAVEGVNRYDIWLHPRNLFPLKAESRDAHGEVLESVTLDDAKIDVCFPDGFFDG